MEAQEERPKSPSTSVPVAKIREGDAVAARNLKTRVWWLTAACALLAIGLVASNLQSQGYEITVRFDEGHGLKPGDSVRYRGIEVGEVLALSLNKSLDGIEVQLTLNAGHEALAAEGSLFWIERARVSLSSVSGLDTVLGAKYIGVVPGNEGAPAQRLFTGVENRVGIADRESSEIQVSFPNGEGLLVGDPVRYLGMIIGEVSAVSIDTQQNQVLVALRLEGEARQLAREGTQFWIEKPRLDLTEVRGLETLIAGRYVTLQPFAPESPLQSKFVGLAEPPPLPLRTGSLEIELDAETRLGLVRGAPVLYRGLEVGRIDRVGIAKDAASVKVAVVIDREFVELVRDNSKWWSAGGVKVDAGLRGVELSVESLSAWVRGGVAFATPEKPGPRVVTGHRFMLEEAPQKDWLQWRPRIAVGSYTSGVSGQPLPVAVRVVASWNASLLGLYRRQTLQSWAIALDDGTLGISTRFLDEALAESTSVQLEIAGQSLAIKQAATKRGELSSRMKLNQEVIRAVRTDFWPSSQITDAKTVQGVMLVCNPLLKEPLAIDQTRVTYQSGVGWAIAPGVAIAETLEGSPVISAQDGKVVGQVLQEDDGGWVIASLK